MVMLPAVSWISAEDNAGGAGLFTDGKTLYILRLGRGTEMGQPEETLETSASQIQRMDLNGENRELVIRLDGSDCIASSIVEDQDTLYFLRDSIEQIDDEIPVVRQLVAMDMEKNSRSYCNGRSKYVFGGCLRCRLCSENT